MDISRPCERIDPPRSVHTNRISSCPGSKPGLVSVPGGSSIALRARCYLYRPSEEAISSSPGNLRHRNIVPPRKIYRSPRESLSSALGRYIVSPRKTYRPAQEIIKQFCLQIRCFVVTCESPALYLFLLNVYCVSNTKAQRFLVVSKSRNQA